MQLIFRHGGVQSIKIDDQHIAFITFWDSRYRIESTFCGEYSRSTTIKNRIFMMESNVQYSKVLLETSPSHFIRLLNHRRHRLRVLLTMTNALMEKTMTAGHEDRDKRISRSQYSPEENTRWVILREIAICD